MLAIAVVLGGCAAASSAEPSGGADPPGSGAAAGPRCGPDEGMGRTSQACPQGKPKVVEHRPRYKSDQAEQYQGSTYYGQSYGSCKSLFKVSYQAYKACLRY